MEGSAMVQMGDREACDRVIYNLNGASCFGNNLSIRSVVFAVHLLQSCLLLRCFARTNFDFWESLSCKPIQLNLWNWILSTSINSRHKVCHFLIYRIFHTWCLWSSCNLLLHILKNISFLWSPYVIGQTIIFSSCFFFFLFFPRLISAVGDWMFTILLHMVWP